MRKIGAHLRLETTLVAMIHQALRLGLDFFQCFLTLRTAGRLIPLNTSDVNAFVQLRRKHFYNLYLHASYWINLSSVADNPHYLLRKEIIRAKRLEFTHMILHPGSARGAKNKMEGIDALARMMNELIMHETDLKFVLENITQGPPSIGGSFSDFALLLEKIDKPEKMYFCIDTGHAYSFGYDLANEKQQEIFIQMIDDAISLDRVVLIHLNNTKEKLGSKIDKHETFLHGNIGIEQLKHFIFHPRLQNIPILIEPPVLLEDELKKEFDMVVNWQKEFEKEKV